MWFQQAFLFASVFGSVGAVAWTVAEHLANGRGRRISDRLKENRGRGGDDADASGSRARRAGPFRRLATLAARPFIEANGSDKLTGLRARLANAGIYDPAAIRTLVGFKFMLMVGGVVLGYLLGDMAGLGVMGMAFGGLFGYLAPQLWLGGRVSGNQKALNTGLPDAMDLMVICVESGLTVDATMLRVGEELAFAQPAISREFGICHTEMRLGVARQQSFKNLATRTGNANLKSLTAMLVQADRFGTSVATALRVQAEAMRTKRQFAAEEIAAKASVKMTFPLVLFIFPATFIVMMGPMAVQFMTQGFM